VARTPQTHSSIAVPEGEEKKQSPLRPAAASDQRYSIRVVSRLTAIGLDTLRIWERRYGYPRPARTRGGSRVYSGSDVLSLKLIRRAIEHGYRPGEVVGKSHDELTRLIQLSSPAPRSAPSEAPTVSSLLTALGRDDLAALRSEVRQASMILGPRRFLIDVVHPLSVRVGELWAEGKLEVRQEHLLTEALSAHLRVLMSAYEDRPGASRVLLATLPSERHGLGLEMVQVYLALSQVAPVLLGVDTPPDQIVKAARRHAVDAVGLLVTRAADLKTATKQIRWMLAELPRRVGVWIGGEAGPDLPIQSEALRIATTWQDLDDAIAGLERRSTDDARTPI